MKKLDSKHMHPRDQIAMIIARIYKGGLTTTSGGNISIIDEQNDIWVTPAGVDKGTLTAKDIVQVKADGTIIGLHKPSSEFPFHRAIFEKRPDLKAVIHAHPPALVSFSIVRQCPDTNLIPQAKAVCGPIGYAEYALPGSQELGDVIALEFEKGMSAVIMENHGVVVGGSDLLEAYERFETLEFCARTIIAAKTIGEPISLSNDDILRFEGKLSKTLPVMETVSYPSDEREIRSEICKIVRRACDQGLMISTYGTVSARWRDNDFLITPKSLTRFDIQPEDVVQIKDGMSEPNKMPSRSVKIHQEIYRQYPKINAIVTTQAPHVMAFGITGTKFDDRTIPESWILLQDVPIIPFSIHFEEGEEVFAETIGQNKPCVLIQNDSIMVTGTSLLHAFDRLEVAEFSAKALIYSAPLGKMVPINEKQIEDLRTKFLL